MIKLKNYFELCWIKSLGIFANFALKFNAQMTLCAENVILMTDMYKEMLLNFVFKAEISAALFTVGNNVETMTKQSACLQMLQSLKFKNSYT